MGTRAGDSCRVANFSFVSFEPANFAASASIFRGCSDTDVDDTAPVPLPTPFPPVPPKVDCVPETVLLPSPEDEVKVMEACLANVAEDPRTGEDETE
jgi:hypothetical protein